MDPTATAPPPPPAAPTPPSTPNPPSYKRLRRDREHRVLGGVAAGIARTYGIDIVVVRVLWVLAALVWIGIPAYVVAWIAIPPADGSAEHARHDRPRDLGMLIGLVLVGIGVLIASHQIFHGFPFGSVTGPLVLIAAGAAILVFRRPTPPDPETPVPEATTTPTTTTTTIEADGVEAPTEQTETVAPDETPDETSETTGETTTAWMQAAPWPSARELRHDARRARRRARPRAFLGPLTVSILLLGAGVAGLLRALNVLDVNLTVLLALGTMLIGAALVVSTWVGRARGLIALGLLFVMATAISATLDIPLRGGTGNLTYAPQTASDLRSSYALSAGRMQLDLTQLDPTQLDAQTTIDAQVGVGVLRVIVPANVHVVAEVHAGAGEINLFDHRTSGWHVDATNELNSTLGSDRTLILHLHIGAGYVEVNA